MEGKSVQSDSVMDEDRNARQLLRDVNRMCVTYQKEYLRDLSGKEYSIQINVVKNIKIF